MDIARWGMDLGLPTKVTCTGGRFIWNDQGETANTQTAVFDYGDREISFEVKNVSYINVGEIGVGNARDPNVIGDVFFGSDGTLVVEDRGFQVYKGQKREKIMDEKKDPRDDTAAHMENFLAACRSRNYKDLHADVQIGVLSADLCHLANIAYRTGRRLQFDPESQKFLGDSQADRLTTRVYRKGYVVPDNV